MPIIQNPVRNVVKPPKYPRVPYGSEPGPAAPVRYPAPVYPPGSFPGSTGIHIPLPGGPVLASEPYEPYAAPALTSGPSGPALPMPTGGGGGGGPSLTWKANYSAPDAPDWWRGVTPSKFDANTEYASLLNAMLPYLSTEDQRTVASSLARLYPDAFGQYDPVTADNYRPTTDITTGLQDKYTQSTRAQLATNALMNMINAAGKKEKDLGPGYQFLRQLVGVTRDFGGVTGQHQTRSQYQQMLGALDPLLAETKDGSLSAFGPLARMFAQPFFSAGQLTPAGKDRNNQYIFGQPNPALF